MNCKHEGVIALGVALVFVMCLVVVSGLQAQAGADGVRLSEDGVPWGEHEFYMCDSPRQLLFGHAVPPGEKWVLTGIHAKNNSGPTSEINVAVYADDLDAWICLASKADAARYDGVAWSGALEMGEQWMPGAWFRGAAEGDVLQFDATWTRYGVVITSAGRAVPLGTKALPPVPYE